MPTVAETRHAPRGADALRLALGWTLTRALLLVTLLGGLGYPAAVVRGDVGLYRGWSEHLVHGSVPDSSHWQYPPAAGLWLALPRLLSSHYEGAFVLLSLALDAAVLLVLVRLTSARHRAPWLWVVGVAALGPVALARFDLAPTAAAVVSVALLVRHRAGSAGAAAGVGAALKVWPLIVIAAARRGVRRPWLLAFVAAAGSLEVLAMLLLSGSSSPLGHASGRRLEIESVPATPFLLARLVGAPVTVGGGHGAQEVVVAGSALIATLLAVASVLAVAVLVARTWTQREPPPLSAPLAALSVLLVLSPVLSAQYVVWAVGLGAVAATTVATRRHDLLLLIGVCVMTQLVFPVSWDALVSGSWWAVLLLTGRNALLVTLCVRLVRAASPTREAR